jgi:hypothetical protein
MGTVPCRDRTFPLGLASEFEYYYWYFLHWLRNLLERLGPEHALALWEDAYQSYDEELLVQILSSGWEADEAGEASSFDELVSSNLEEVFPSPVEGVTGELAGRIMENTPPFRQIRQSLPSPNLRRESTTYEALHLFRDGLAVLAELLIERYRKQGELIAYDTMLGELSEEDEPDVSVKEFMSKRQARFTSGPDEPDMHSAGLEVDFIRGSESEVVTRVTECEWARYYRERHPSVGYMLACALDAPVYRWFNERLRLQRTSTLMEGGTECDFRVYALQDS